MRYGWHLLGETRRRLILANLTHDVLPFGPSNVEFQPAWPAGRMDYPRFTGLVDELAATGLTSACFSGEPLAHPQLADMLYYLADRNVAVTEVRTGGAGLADEVIRALLAAGVHALLLDVGEVGTPSGQDLLEEARRLRDTRNSRGYHLPKLVCRFTVRPGNAEHVQSAAETARELECSHVIFDATADAARWAAAGEIERMHEDLDRVRAEVLAGRACGTAFPAPARAARAAAEGEPIRTLSPLVYRGEGDEPSVPCRRHRLLPWAHALVDARLRVWPDRRAAAEGEAFGDSRAEPFAAAWNGPAFQAHRRRARDAAPAAAWGEVGERDDGCAYHADAVSGRFLAEAEARLARQAEGAPLPPWPAGPEGEGFAAPALRAIRTLYPRGRFAPGEAATVERIHAEAEMARVESLRLQARAAQSAAHAGLLERAPDGVPGAAAARVEARRMRRVAAELASYSERLFAEAGIAGGAEQVAAAPPPFASMRDWVGRLAALDPTVEADVDESRVVWLSLFKTLDDNADLSKVHRALGVGVGYGGPEQHYNDFFAEHVCADLVDYSHLNPSLKFVVADIEKGVDFPDGHFDLVYSHSAFEHLKDAERAIVEIDRLLGVGKYAYITIQPLYYSPTGSHVNTPRRLARWEHLYPDSEYYLLDSPHVERIDEGFYLNKMTVADFLAAAGRVGWEVRHFGMRIVHPRDVPAELAGRFPLVDLVVEEFRFVGEKVIPKSRAEW